MAAIGPASGNTNNAFTPDANLVAQITGSGNPIAGNTTATYVASGNTSITSILQYSRWVTMTTATGNTTVLTSNSVVPAGGIVTIQINNDSSSARTITWGTGFRSNTTTVGVASKAQVCLFISDGTTLNMVAQSPTGAE